MAFSHQLSMWKVISKFSCLLEFSQPQEHAKIVRSLNTREALGCVKTSHLSGFLFRVGYWFMIPSSTSLRLNASSRRNTFLPIYVTFWDAQNQPNKCTHLVLIPTKIHCIHFVSMNLANMSPLQMWPVLDAVEGLNQLFLVTWQMFLDCGLIDHRKLLYTQNLWPTYSLVNWPNFDQDLTNLRPRYDIGLIVKSSPKRV